jgi:hypothetical protein
MNITSKFLKENVIDGTQVLFNTTTNCVIDVNDENVSQIASDLGCMAVGHGIGHLEYRNK